QTRVVINKTESELAERDRECIRVSTGTHASGVLLKKPSVVMQARRSRAYRPNKSAAGSVEPTAPLLHTKQPLNRLAADDKSCEAPPSLYRASHQQPCLMLFD